MAKQISGSNRRQFLIKAGKAGAALSLGASPVILGIGKARAATTISLVSYGGSYGDFVKEHWIKPFTAETGIAVEYVSGPDLAKIKAQVTNNNVEWDVFDAPGSAAFAGVKENLWEPIDTRIVDLSRFVKTPGSDQVVPTFIYTGGIAFDPARTRMPARDFQQLWDIVKFPGRRALRTRVSETIELALLADGVEPSKLYPLDLDRGFKALERIKNDVKKWFDQTTQGITLIQTNESDYTYTYANRVKAAKEAGVSIDFSFDQCLSSMNYYCIPRGSPRKEAAMRFLEFITRTDKQALMAEKTAFIPVAKGAVEQLSAEVRKWQPDFNNPKNVFVSDEYWRDNFVAADKRFKEWILT